MKQNRIHYSTVMALGFKRKNCSDSVFFDEYGYDWFIVTKKLMKGLMIEWSCITGTCQLYRCNKDGNIIAREKLQGLEEIERFIRLLGKKKDRDILNSNNYIDYKESLEQRCVTRDKIMQDIWEKEESEPVWSAVYE